MSAREYVSETRVLDGGQAVVRATQIASTDFVVLTAWDVAATGYSTVGYDETVGRLGKIGTGPLPKRISDLALASDARIRACARRKASEWMRAYRAIETAYPGILLDADSTPNSGEVWIPAAEFRALVEAAS